MKVQYYIMQSVVEADRLLFAKVSMENSVPDETKIDMFGSNTKQHKFQGTVKVSTENLISDYRSIMNSIDLQVQHGNL